METTKKNLEQANKDLEAKEKALQAVSEYCLMFVIILPVVWYGYEFWSLTLGDERRPRVFENRVLKRIFGPKGNELTLEWRKLHNGELNDLCCSKNIVRVMKSRKMIWAGHVACMEERIGAYRDLVGKPDGDGPLGRPRHRWEGNIKMDLQELGCGGVETGSIWLRIGTGSVHLLLR